MKLALDQTSDMGSPKVVSRARWNLEYSSWYSVEQLGPKFKPKQMVEMRLKVDLRTHENREMSSER